MGGEEVEGVSQECFVVGVAALASDPNPANLEASGLEA
jgi:hypothetical protein